MESTEQLKQQITELTARVKELETRCDDIDLRTTDDDESFRSFSKRINEYGDRTENAVSAIQEKFSNELARFGEMLYAKFAKDIANDPAFEAAIKDLSLEAASKVTPEILAESLTKRILTVRPAGRGETEGVVAVRNASISEIRGAK
jgi:hypothetical protein